MKISLCLAICLLTIEATAGGIRGAYERMFVWYAYQAEIEYAREKHKTFSINNLQICPRKEGSGKDQTLTFGEFLELSNRNGNAQGATPKLTSKGTLWKTAGAILDLQGRYAMKPRWKTPSNIAPSAKNSYTDMLKEVAKVLAKCKKEMGNDGSNAKLASGALNELTNWRKADYDLHRVPALKKDPNFKKIEWEFWTIQVPGEEKKMKNIWNKHINWQATADNAANSWYENIADIKKHVLDWERNTYFQGPEGARAKKHKNAIAEVQKAVDISNNRLSC
ncbi:uncharacterized protein Triagg1_270 [Trichoderma aggressivum f. europaeum]|uniref:Uncharacterized protein n=1 Tax=Trichoderma aggressivum f. europaeum TaxID=173218 RepID=A0AAE1JIL8_9HYPO|nr:hypothetical protein Triagg1_270 [Trichoderma aggressivum f. europaeum]